MLILHTSDDGKSRIQLRAADGDSWAESPGFVRPGLQPGFDHRSGNHTRLEAAESGWGAVVKVSLTTAAEGSATIKDSLTVHPERKRRTRSALTACCPDAYETRGLHGKPTNHRGFPGG